MVKPADERVRGLRLTNDECCERVSPLHVPVCPLASFVPNIITVQLFQAFSLSFPFLFMSSFFFCHKRPLEFNRKYMAILMYVLCHSANCGHDNTRAYKQYFGRAVYEDNLLVSTGR